MTYCRKCGLKLDEEARFCRNCGSPVETPRLPLSDASSRQKARPFPWMIVTVLIAILIVGFIVAALAFAPFQRVNFQQTESQPMVSGVDVLSFRFEADVANVNVICKEMPNQLAKIDVSANGSIGLFGSSKNPVRFNFVRQISTNAVAINCQIERPEPWPVSNNLNVIANIYVNPSVGLKLNIQTGTGKITFNTVDGQASFQELYLHATTGDVQANLSEDNVLTGRNASCTTTTGNVQFTWRNARVTDNVALNIASTTGSVSAEITQIRAMAGNVTLSAATTTGNIDLALSLRGNVGAQITSNTGFGSVSTNVQNFNGNKSPIYSSNYPAFSDFIVGLSTTTGNVHVTANYQGSQTPPNAEREQIRDSAMTFVKTNHPETAEFMNDLSWTGGRVETGLVGSEIYTWQSKGWNFTITNPVVPNPVYTLSVDYQTQGISIPYRIVWTGTWREGTMKETSFVFAQ